MFSVVLALFGIQLTLAGLAFAVTSGPQAGAGLAIIGIVVELVALSRFDSQPPTSA
jgi:hypothetical protein